MTQVEINNILHRVAQGTTTELDAEVLAEILDSKRNMERQTWWLMGFGLLLVLILVVMT